MDNKRDIRKTIMIIIIPIILENIFQVSANIVSAAMVGRLTAIDISAQGISFNVTGLLLTFIKGISIGASIFIARAFGAKEFNKCKSIFRNSVTITIIVIIVLQVVIFFGAHVFFEFLTDDVVIIAKAVKYIRIMIIGLPCVVIINFVTATFQGFGNTKVPMYIAVVMNIINVTLGYLLIFGAFGVPQLGLYGAAIALVASQFISAIIGLICLYSKRGLFQFTTEKIKKFKFDYNCIKNVYLMGIPVGLESMFWQLSAIVMSKIILTYGQASFAAYQLGIQAETLTEMPAIGFGVAAVTLSARAIGEKNNQLFKDYFRHLIKFSGLISVFTSLVLILLPKVFMKILTNNLELQLIGATYILVMGFIQIPQNLSRIYNGTIRASGYKNIPMYIAGIGIWLFRIPLALLIVYVLKWDIKYIWICIAIDQIVRFILSVYIYKRKDIDNVVLRINNGVHDLN